MSEYFWLTDKQWAKLAPLLPPDTRYDRLAEPFMATACITAIVAFWPK